VGGPQSDRQNRNFFPQKPTFWRKKIVGWAKKANLFVEKVHLFGEKFIFLRVGPIVGENIQLFLCCKFCFSFEKCSALKRYYFLWGY
jgi:hypothetical protein